MKLSWILVSLASLTSGEWQVAKSQWDSLATRRASLATAAPLATYLVFVASEGNDHIGLVRWGPNGASFGRDHRIGINPTELLGPHGLAVSPDGKFYYVTSAHGTPYGAVWKFTTDRDSLIG